MSLKGAALNFVMGWLARWLPVAGKSIPAPLKIRSILVSAQMGIGNMFLFLPLVKALASQFQDAQITVLFSDKKGAQELARTQLPFVSRWITLEGKGSFSSRFFRGFKISGPFDLAVCRFNGHSPEVLGAMVRSRTRWRCGHVSSAGWTLPSDGFFNLPVSMEEGAHEWRRYGQLAEAMGIPQISLPSLDIGRADRGVAESLLRELGISDNRFFCFHAGSSEGQNWKRWPIVNWRRLSEVVADAGWRAVFVGSSAEASQIESEIIAGRPGVVSVAGRCSLLESFAVLERARAFVGADSAFMHAAAALDIPSLCLYGPTDEKRTGPLGARSRLLRSSVCQGPCMQANSVKLRSGCTAAHCMASLAPDFVAKELLKLTQ